MVLNLEQPPLPLAEFRITPLSQLPPFLWKALAAKGRQKPPHPAHTQPTSSSSNSTSPSQAASQRRTTTCCGRSSRKVLTGGLRVPSLLLRAWKERWWTPGGSILIPLNRGPLRKTWRRTAMTEIGRCGVV